MTNVTSPVQRILAQHRANLQTAVEHFDRRRAALVQRAGSTTDTGSIASRALAQDTLSVTEAAAAIRVYEHAVAILTQLADLEVPE